MLVDKSANHAAFESRNKWKVFPGEWRLWYAQWSAYACEVLVSTNICHREQYGKDTELALSIEIYKLIFFDIRWNNPDIQLIYFTVCIKLLLWAQANICVWVIFLAYRYLIQMHPKVCQYFALSKIDWISSNLKLGQMTIRNITKVLYRLVHVLWLLLL